jgi:hypothetical protein
MPLPYTLDLTPLVSYGPQKKFENNQPEDVRWLNDKKAHDGNFYFMAGYYEFVEERYFIQTLKIPARNLTKERLPNELKDLPETLENAFRDDKDADSNLRLELFDNLFDAGGKHNDFEKDGILVPAQVNICFHKNEALGKPPYILTF